MLGSKSESKPIGDRLKRMWTENGDKLSNQYAGTDTNNSGVIEKDNMGIAGKFGKMFTGVRRYIKNTFTD